MLRSEEYPWPEKGDSLFQESDRRRDAWIHPMDVNFTVYASTYRKGAERLLQTVSPGKRPDELLIYPILFLYRHHVELGLKYILSVWCDYEERNFKSFTNHKLKYLWTQCRKVIEDTLIDGDDEPTEAVEKMIFELDGIDPRSMSFRYPIDLDGKTSFGKEQFVDLERLFIGMQKVSNYLEAAAMGVSEYYNQLRDMEDY